MKPLAYRYTNSEGVFLNAELVAASDAVYNVYGDMDNYLTSLDGLSYVSILEETIEHELGHLKNHQHLMYNPSFSQSTQVESPLKGESGYAVQLGIRRRFFGQDSKSILQASEQCHRRRFMIPVNVRLVDIGVWQGEYLARSISPSHPLCMEQLIDHMDHKSYTFFRLFCASRSSEYQFYSNWTPESKGMYTAVVTFPEPDNKGKEWSKTFQIITGPAQAT